MLPAIDRTTGLDTSDKETKGLAASAAASISGTGGADRSGHHAQLFADGRLLKLAQEAEAQSTTFFQTGVRTYWARSYKAFRSQHFDGSKYLSSEYRGRSKYFRPKTRIAVMKSMAQAAQSLFSTGDVISVQAMHEGDPLQEASAALKQELINYRLSRVSRRNGVPWFLTAMGAVQTAKITGVVVSKQSWRYREDDEASAYDQFGNPTGQPPILEDRPFIELIASENCLFDPNCDWTNPAQSSQYLMIRHPMSVDEAWTMIEQGISSGKTAFRSDLRREDLEGRVQSSAPIDTVPTRTAREGGKDPIQQASGHFGRIWVNEVFMRIGNLDVVYWTLDNSFMLSEATPVRRAYPHLSGERPVVIGYGALEAFRPYPQSPVESWQQMQMELNDQTNLRVDHMKNVVSPPAKVVRGQKVDLTQVQRRGPNGIVMVTKPEDVEWWQAPDAPQSAFMENNLLSADFDSLASVFDSSTVMNNRQMNETVGGMRLLNATTNSMADFDLSLFVETWAEPVLWQLMKLEEFYENDATILQIAGEKAQLFQKFGIDAITDDLLARETTLTIKLGVGTANLPDEKLRNFANAFQVASSALMPFVQTGVVGPPVPKVSAIIDEIFGAAHYKDAGQRFFQSIDNPPPQQPQQGPDPAKMAEVQLKGQKLQLDAQKAQADAELAHQKLIAGSADNAAKIEASHMKALAEIGKAFMEGNRNMAAQGHDHAHQQHMQDRQQAHELMKHHLDQQAAHAQMAQQAAMQQLQGGTPGQDQPAGQPSQPAGQPADEEKALRMQHMQAQMQRAEERHKAVMDLAAKMKAPLRVVRDESGRVVGAK